jgi:hypothetical protein
MPKTLFIILIILILVSGAFYGGMKYQQAKNPLDNFSRQNLQNLTREERQQLFQGNVGGAIQRGLNRGDGSNFFTGEIISKDEQGLTIKTPNGSSKIVFFSGSTEISKFTSGTKEDLEIGKTVSVTGSANQDGSITAKLIQLRPAISPNP